ncbi:flagellar hook-length control protein FliK [Homoserinimonas aerilata]|uniref:Flagellar hook-length control protein FliK n=1 Tax=Homoserinimonas aerilata TaxID=1162970 RepID=A0A542YEU2_9MICO|nr:flagellar hook-length control protein FliK [Homoserinimonas aerilata]TQL46616.1 flagellar hook-length control protein FliK [Homoserinimonas aerilata]
MSLLTLGAPAAARPAATAVSAASTSASGGAGAFGSAMQDALDSLGTAAETSGGTGQDAPSLSATVEDAASMPTASDALLSAIVPAAAQATPPVTIPGLDMDVDTDFEGELSTEPVDDADPAAAGERATTPLSASAHVSAVAGAASAVASAAVSSAATAAAAQPNTAAQTTTQQTTPDAVTPLAASAQLSETAAGPLRNGARQQGSTAAQAQAAQPISRETPDAAATAEATADTEAPRPAASAAPVAVAAQQTAPAPTAAPIASVAPLSSAPAEEPAPATPAQPAAAAMTPASAPLATASAQPSAPVAQAQQVPQGFAAQLTRPIVALSTLAAGEHTITVSVTPDTLGPVTVRAHVGADGMRLELFAPSDAGREALKAILPDLRRDLAAAGVNVPQLSTGQQAGQSATGQQAGGQASLELSSHDSPSQQPEGRARHRAAEAAEPEATRTAALDHLGAGSIDILA